MTTDKPNSEDGTAAPAVGIPLDRRVRRPDTERDELTALRKRVKAQRAELRRLNKTLGPYWQGFRSGLAFDHVKDFRVKMFAAFGSDAVFKAEHADCCCRAAEMTDGSGWWCALHGYQKKPPNVELNGAPLGVATTR